SEPSRQPSEPETSQTLTPAPESDVQDVPNPLDARLPADLSSEDHEVTFSEPSAVAPSLEVEQGREFGEHEEALEPEPVEDTTFQPVSGKKKGKGKDKKKKQQAPSPTKPEK